MKLRNHNTTFDVVSEELHTQIQSVRVYFATTCSCENLHCENQSLAKENLHYLYISQLQETNVLSKSCCYFCPKPNKEENTKDSLDRFSDVIIGVNFGWLCRFTHGETFLPCSTHFNKFGANDTNTEFK